MSFRICAGSITGRDHLLDGRNCQDALHYLEFEVEGAPYVVGVVADGCGEGLYSEVGARLVAPFVCQSIRNSLRNNVPLEDLPNLLLVQVKRFLYLLLDGYDFSDEGERDIFIHNHLLFTLVGFVITPQETLTFLAGDGLIQVNDVSHCIREEAPAYLTYMLVKPDGQVGDLPGFTLYSLPTAELERLMIGSDAWLDEPELRAEVWRGRTPVAMQRLMNRWSDAQHFRDDASLITVVREREEVRA
ncbi:protein phosphatase 2C domain-containing protein [Ktedonospora formicarum]|uniref:PPM-type phosphatase domain-containing protein n=1 Tax=Ktedonospora formicarum TaxID=2778364 RepID=A0A8J3MVR3_9CHLR|nr:protein phosphatase 2C domain-containing protein [Ktedonospora formicarum]GHO47923.1 hypothetical protein KSX_60860 [Ktedonospora formicarum]